MNHVKHGDLLREVTAGIIVHQVNAQGAMGAGIAKSIRSKWPQVYEEYVKVIGPVYSQSGEGRHFLGKVIYVEVEPGLFVANLVGQQFFGRTGERFTSYDALDAGFRDIHNFALLRNLPVHYPLIGCGLGGGEWSIVSAIINARLDKIDHTLWMKA